MTRGSTSIKPGSTLFARGVVYMAGAAALAVCLILLPELIREESVRNPINPYVTYGFLTVAYSIATPFFVALHQTLKLLQYIDKNKAFSHQSIRSLRNIKFCAITFSVLIAIAVTGGISIIKSIEPREDVTGFVTLGVIFTFIPSVIAVFIAVLQRLLADAVAMKSENDLIV